jgi:hypothetical protein
MKSQIRKVLVRFLFIPLICLTIFIIAAIAVLYSQQQPLVTLAVKELNKKLPGELVIGSSNISIFQNFPYVSISMNDIRFYSKQKRFLQDSVFRTF